MDIKRAIEKVSNFEGNGLTGTLCDIEIEFNKANRVNTEILCEKFQLDADLLSSAFKVKKAAAQINVTIHAVGILLALPHILIDDEHVESLSLGAGNTGRSFDLETNKRVAEFKFINWQGGAESIRQNSLFKDFYELAEYEGDKQRYLYVIGKQIPLKFFKGSRSIKSILSKNTKLSQEFLDKYDDRFAVVNEYYQYKKDAVVIEDIAKILQEIQCQY